MASLRQASIADKTIAAYRRDCRQFLIYSAAEGKDFPGKVDYRFLRRYAAWLAGQRYEKSSISRKLSAVRGLFRFCRSEELLGHNPADSLSSPKMARKLPVVLRPSEVESFLGAIDTRTPLGMRDRAIFELLYGCGLRSEEVVNLRQVDVDHEQEEIKVTGKGKKTRMVPAGELALEALREYQARGRPQLLSPEAIGNGDEPDWIFLSARGNQLGTSDIRRRTIKYVR
ncbi:MAG: tyrosine-type recombinase/integrase, partial [Pseudomonadota bacterium]